MNYYDFTNHVCDVIKSEEPSYESFTKKCKEITEEMKKVVELIDVFGFANSSTKPNGDLYSNNEVSQIKLTIPLYVYENKSSKYLAYKLFYKMVKELINTLDKEDACEILEILISVNDDNRYNLELELKYRVI